jgi:predicted ester cyclase
MKRLYVLLIAISLSGCNQTSNPECETLQQSKVNLDANVDMYRTVWDKILNERNIDLINTDSFDAQVSEITSSETITGIEDFKAYYKNYLTGFSDAKFTMIDVYGQGDLITKHWRFQGTHDGELFGIPVSNNIVDLYGVSLVVMKDGKVFQEQNYFDNIVFMKQLGLIE